MKSIDPSTAAQVWQRVAAPPSGQLPPDSLRGLIQSALELEGMYRKLTGILTGNPQGLCRQLLAQQQKTLATLKGLQLLSGSPAANLRKPELPAQNAGALLPGCYRRCRQAMEEYAARAISPEFGPVFRALLQREESQSVLIAEVLGSRNP